MLSTRIILLTIFTCVACQSFTACSDITNLSIEDISGKELKEVSKLHCGGNIINEDTPSPLFVVNDLIIHQDSLKHVEPEYINTITVLKDKEAIKLYGALGEHGAVQIQTDQENFSAFKKIEN